MLAARRAGLCTLVCVVLSVLAPPLAATANSSDDAALVSYTNSARAQHGLRSYVESSDLAAVARRWAAHMAAARTLEHNPDVAGEVCCWTALGENVGVGGSASQVQNAFMASSPHRDNILSSTYTQFGVGTARGSDGRLYVDEVFRRPTGTVASPRVRPAQPSQVTYRSAPARASRSAVRLPRAVRRAAPARLLMSVMFLRQVRQGVPARLSVDPVVGAWGYLRVMAALTR